MSTFKFSRWVLLGRGRNNPPVTSQPISPSVTECYVSWRYLRKDQRQTVEGGNTQAFTYLAARLHLLEELLSHFLERHLSQLCNRVNTRRKNRFRYQLDNYIQTNTPNKNTATAIYEICSIPIKIKPLNLHPNWNVSDHVVTCSVESAMTIKTRVLKKHLVCQAPQHHVSGQLTVPMKTTTWWVSIHFWEEQETFAFSIHSGK